MNNFNIIYKILKALEAAMYLDLFDLEQISPESLKISQNRHDAILTMVSEKGYIEGVTIRNSMN